MALANLLRQMAPPVCLAAVVVLSLPLAASAPGGQDGSSERLILVHPKGSPQPGVLDAEVDRAAYLTMLAQRRISLQDFPVPALAPVDLELTAFDVLSPDARLVAVDGSGEREVPRPALRSFRGVVRGDSTSVAVLSLFDGRIAGSIRTGGEEFVIAPSSSGRRSPTRVRVWNRRADPDQPDRPMCALGAAQFEVAAPASEPSGLPSIDGNTLLRAEVAIDATYQWYSRFGSLAAAQSYILNLMAQVSTIYESEVRVQLEIPYLRIFTTPADPYSDSTTDTLTLLNELRSEWNAHQTAIDRTVVHLFSVRPSGGAGIAYLDVLCSHDQQPGNSVDYGVSTLSASGGSWEKSLVAHELGHNFSSPHTHCYVPEIDQCANESGCYSGPVVPTVGTIMSYCSQVSPVFHPRVEDERIRPAAEAAVPTCMTAVGPSGAPAPPQGLTAF